MAANFTAITDATLEQDKPIRQSTARALRDNPEGIAAGVSGAPKVQSAAIEDNAVTTAKILNANVTASKLGTASVETAKIKDAAVTTAKIKDADVTTAKLASGERMTTANVLGATAGAGSAAVGSYGLFRLTLGSLAFGGTVGGSSLRPANAAGGIQASAQSGTWRCMGVADGASNEGNTTVFLRIS